MASPNHQDFANLFTAGGSWTGEMVGSLGNIEARMIPIMNCQGTLYSIQKE
jgi:hypothetical protein